MKEIIALDEKIAALPDDVRPGETLDISRAERAAEIETLPADLRAEIDALQHALNAAVPEPFDYFVFLGGDEGPHFSLHLDQMPTVAPGDGEFDAERSIIEQLQGLDWEKQGVQAVEGRDQMDQVMYLLDRLGSPLPSAKRWQREFREEIKDFVKDKRRDATKIHVFAWDEEAGLLESEYADGDALREALPVVIMRGHEVISVVAFGKPLPVERIDALKAEAQRKAQERLPQEVAAQAEREDDGEVREVEAEVMTEDREEPPSAGEKALD